MAHIGEKLRELLENSELREALADAFYTGIDSPEQFEEISLAEHLRHARGIDVSDPPFEDLPAKLEEVIQSLVIDRLPQPTPITLDDLSSLAISHLAGIDLSQADEDENTANAYERFVTCAVLEIEQERRIWGQKGYHSLGDGWGAPEPGSALAEHARELGGAGPSGVVPSTMITSELWSSPSGFSVECVIGGYSDCTCDHVFGQFSGYCSEAALQQLESQFKRLVGFIAKTVQLCGNFPCIDFLLDGDGLRVIAACLSAYYDKPGTGHATILDRLRNAVVLLSHADSASADPISLSLSFAAIEALVCEHKESLVNKQIKRHVSTLLVQNDNTETLVGERKAREKVLDKLYDIRCQVMHGNQVNASCKAAECVRQIAAGVVRGVVSWKENQQRTGADISWKEFMDEINAAARKPGRVVGVPDLSELIPAKVPS